jgi:hypothetical protein
MKIGEYQMELFNSQAMQIGASDLNYSSSHRPSRLSFVSFPVIKNLGLVLSVVFHSLARVLMICFNKTSILLSAVALKMASIGLERFRFNSGGEENEFTLDGEAIYKKYVSDMKVCLKEDLINSLHYETIFKKLQKSLFCV